MNRRQLIAATLKLTATVGLGLLPERGGKLMAASGDGRPVATTAEGRLRGISTPALDIFKGVRYGEDTSGMRFRPPVPVRSWRGIREATVLGSPCFQRNIDTSPWQDPQPESEDCLFLNVWSPKSASRLPVMVWIHGGGYWWGSGGTPMYDGASLAERGNVIVVTLNHRLNLFGYLYLGGLSPEFADSANLGQLDLIEALRWVQRNIAAFGGDPDNVTIFGESGGGAKVSALLAMPAARGLFHRAIVQSGSVLRFQSEDEATDEARAVLGELGVSDVGQLRMIAPARLVSAYDAIFAKRSLSSMDHLPFSPVQHAATAPYQPTEAAALALWKDVPLLVGTTEAEAAYLLSLTGSIPRPVDDDALAKEIMAVFKDVSAEEATSLIAAYRENAPAADRQQLLVDITSGDWMWASAVRQAELKAQTSGAPVYMYLYSWKEPFLGGAWAIHGADIVFVFDKLEMPNVMEENTDTPAMRARLDPSGSRYRLRDATMAAWTSFARSGNPASSLLPKWPAYVLADRATMRFDATSNVVKDPFGARIRTLHVTSDPRWPA